MKRITSWITATLAVVALLVAFQRGATGSGGKTGENDQRPATEQTVSPNGSAAPDDGTTDDGDSPKGREHQRPDRQARREQVTTRRPAMIHGTRRGSGWVRAGQVG